MINGVLSKYDYSSIIITFDALKGNFFWKPFKFENSWLLELNLNNIKIGWDKSLQGDFLSKINLYSAEINTWGRHIRRNYSDQIEACRKKLDQLRQSTNPEDAIHYQHTNTKLSKLIA